MGGAGHGTARPGEARLGAARRGRARQGQHRSLEGKTSSDRWCRCEQAMLPKTHESTEKETLVEKMTITIQGTAPLLMHNGQLCDPMNEHTRALSAAVKVAKAKKTDAAWEAAAKTEFIGGLYLNERLEPCIPGELLEAVLVAGAKVTKQGKAVKAGLIVDGNFPLEYKGPRDPEKLWSAKFYKTAGARVGQNRVMRTRPCFTGWKCTFDVHYNPTLLNATAVREFAVKAGAECGLGDFRPRYGRFEVL